MESNKVPNEKFSIDFFSDELDQVLCIPGSVFIADKKEEQETYNLVLSFTHFFNNLRDVAIISKLAVSEVGGLRDFGDASYSLNTLAITLVLV